MRILLVTEDSNIAQKISKNLDKEHILDVVKEASNAVYFAEEPAYSVIILDHAVSSVSINDLCYQIRQRGVRLPILVLSDSENIDSRVSSINQGADVCLPREFDPAELIAQIKALLRRSSLEAPLDNVYKIGDLTIDFWNRSIRAKGKRLRMRKREYDLLEFFILNKNQILSRDKILASLWRDSGETDSNVVDVSVCGLRNTINSLTSLELIKTIYGVGYIFEEPKEAEE
jgi:DNA-binding response OmpR family regulator